MNTFETSRATYNLQEAVKLRKVLEWVKEALKNNLYSRESIIKEIDTMLEIK